jgi:hypothetical protein
MEDRKSTSGSLALREHAAKCFQLASTLPSGGEAEQMRRLAFAYLNLADRIDNGLAGADVARRRRLAPVRDPEG